MTTRAARDTLSRAFGVTRLARLTGLDRCGIEVVAAIRPFGHVLQVSQGKGRTLEHAEWSALSEAIELASAETVDPERLVFSKGPASSTWDALGLTIAWVEGRRFHDGKKSFVPAQAVFCPPAGTCWFGPSITRWSSNGLGAHPTSRAAAERHAVLELMERDALARTLPHGWTPDDALARLWRVGDRDLATRGFSLFLFDLTPGGAHLPVAGALLFDDESDVVPLTAGYACRPTLEAAAEAALLEAAQSRLTEIQGAREDVLIGEREAGNELRRRLAKAKPRSARRTARTGRPTLPSDTTLVTLRRQPWVVKAVSQSALVSELL